MAILKNTIGVACTEHIGYAKSNWKTSALQGLTIDLGEAKKVSGFAYIPCQHPRRPGYPAYMAKGTLEYSDDGTTWKHVETFEFGNLVNDPTKRYLRLADALTTRFLRITALDVVSPKPISASSEVREWPLDLSLSDIEVF